MASNNFESTSAEIRNKRISIGRNYLIIDKYC